MRTIKQKLRDSIDKVGEIAQQLRALAGLLERQVQFPAPNQVVQSPATPAPGDLKPPLDSEGTCIYPHRAHTHRDPHMYNN